MRNYQGDARSSQRTSGELISAPPVLEAGRFCACRRFEVSTPPNGNKKSVQLIAQSDPSETKPVSEG
jgi:hypothetical protein